jgi:hypothetical protein
MKAHRNEKDVNGSVVTMQSDVIGCKWLIWLNRRFPLV